MFSRRERAEGTAALKGQGGWMSVFTRAKDRVGEALSPRVVQPSEEAVGRSWESSSGVISASALTHFERISLNAMEERVLPPEIRIKIVFAQAQAVAQEEEDLLEANVKRLDGLVRTLALYGILERNAMDVDSKKSDKIAPDRERELGKMLVAAVQLELFLMLDEICEAGDMENELFDDLCADVIQEGRRTGFILMTADLLLSPGSGYKRLLQIRKDQTVEEIADVAGLRALGGHDCQRDSSESPKGGRSPRNGGRRRRVSAMDSDCGSPGSAAGGPGLKITRTARSVSANLDGLSPSPSSQRPESRSPSPETGGHRRSQTQRVRDLLSSIDGLVMESEQPEETLTRLSPLSPSSPGARENGGSAAHGGAARGRSVRGHKRQSTGGIDSRASRLSRLSLHTPPPRSGGGSGDEGSGRSPYHRVFFPNERDWRGSPFGSTPTAPELAGRRASVVPVAPGDDEEGGPASADMLLAEVDWLIAGTNAALGVVEGDGEQDGLGAIRGTSEAPPERDEVPESAEAMRVAQEGGQGGLDANLVDPIGRDGLEITPDKRELSPKREKEDVPESADATRVASEAGGEGEDEKVVTPDSRPEEGLPGIKQKGSEGDGGGGDDGVGESTDAQRPAALPLPSPEALTSSPSPEARESSSLRPVVVPSMAEISDGDGEGDEVAAVPPSGEEPAVDAVGPAGATENGERDEGGKEDGAAEPAVDLGLAVAETRGENEGVPTVDVVAGEDAEGTRKGTEAEDDTSAEIVENSGEGESESSTEGVREGAGVEEASDKSSAAAVVEPAAVGGAPASLAIPEEVRENVASKRPEEEDEEEGEESEKPAVDAVVESSVFGRPGREESVSLEQEEENGATISDPIPGDGEDGAVGAATSPESGEAAVAVDPEASGGTELVAEMVSYGEVLRSDVSYRHGDGPEEKVLGSRQKKSGDVVGAVGACVEEEAGSPALDDVEL